MAKFTQHVVLRGSERPPLADLTSAPSPNPNTRLQITVVLRCASATSPQGGAAEHRTGPISPATERMTRAQFVQKRGAREGDVALVREFADAYGLSVAEVSMPRRAVILESTVENFRKAFQVDLYEHQFANKMCRARTGAILIPVELDGIVTAVLGFDDRPQAKPHFRIRTSQVQPNAQPLSGTFSPLQIAELYKFPPNTSGKGQCIAIIELGGGYTAADLTYFFQNIANLPVPKVTAVGVDGGSNTPAGSASGADGEVLLDIEVAGAVAPDASIVVYFAPNTDRGFYDAISMAVHDTANNPSVVSISWGGPESSWTQQATTEFNNVMDDAGTLGVTVCVACGDNGSTDGVTDGAQHVDFPSSSPYALACGGTKLVASGSTISSESVWNEDAKQEGATGGGVSALFAKPAYQSGANIPVSSNPGNFVGRGLPDVAGNADPETGYQVYVDGSQTVIGGTSAVAPLWAGLIARLNEQLGTRIGFLNPALYTTLSNAGALNDIVQGNNGAYSARTGWDACTGWGSPNGTALAAALASAKP